MDQAGGKHDTLRRYSAALPWRERSFRTRLAFFVGCAWTLYIILVMCRFFFLLGIVIYPITHRAVCTGVLVTLVLLGLPARREGSLEKLPWHDVALIAGAVLGCGYVALMGDRLIYEWSAATPLEMALCVGFSAALMEAVRRTAGLPPVFLALGSFFYFVYSDHFPGFLMSTGFTYADALGWMYLSGEGYWGGIVGTVASSVPGFILFGAILRATGASEFFSELARTCLGRYRGGPAKTAVLSSMFFGSLSGSVSANVATTGQITIPMMKKNGFSPELAGAVESVASTGGMYTPPIMGATAFLIADFLGVSYWTVCLGAFLPALLYYATLLFQVDMEATRLGARGEARADLPRVRDVLKKSWMYLPSFFVLVLLLGVMKYSAETSILYTVAALVLCTCLNRETRLNGKRLLVVLEDTAIGMFMVIPLCAIIGILVGAMNITGAGANLSTELGDLAGNNMYVMLFMAGVASFVLGMGMTSVACYLLTVLMLAPAIMGSGLEPLAVHLFLFYYCGLSFITPPVAVAAFVASGISGGNPSRTGVLSLRMGIAGFLVPWAFVVYPALLFIGAWYEILFAFFMALCGIAILSIGLTGFFLVELPVPLRLVCAVCGFGIFVPLPDVAQYSLLGGTLLLFAFIRHYGRKTRARLSFG